MSKLEFRLIYILENKIIIEKRSFSKLTTTNKHLPYSHTTQGEFYISERQTTIFIPMIRSREDNSSSKIWQKDAASVDERCV